MAASGRVSYASKLLASYVVRPWAPVFDDDDDDDNDDEEVEVEVLENGSDEWLLSAVTTWTVVAGVYTFAMGAIYTEGWLSSDDASFVVIAAGVSFFVVIMNISLLFGILMRRDQILKYTLCATLAVYHIYIPMAVLFMIGAMTEGKILYSMLEISRVGMCSPQFTIMYRLLYRLRGGQSAEDKDASPRADGSRGRELPGRELVEVNVPPSYGAAIGLSPSNNGAHVPPSVHTLIREKRFREGWAKTDI